MKTIGFPVSHKENEKRRALLPNELRHIKNPGFLYFEKGYGDVMGISDEEYIKAGAHITSRCDVLKKDIICDPKIGDAAYLDCLSGQTIFGWIHAVQNRDITDKIITHKLTAYAWEDMFDDGRHIFWRNNEIAGEVAIMHAFQLYGIMPYNTKVALIGRGNVGNGALKILTLLGADVVIYNRKMEKLLKKEIGDYDVIVNAVLWDTSRDDHLIYKSDLSRMKKGAMIIDISCDRNGGIETSIPTTIKNPIYEVNGIVHYVVDHTPAMFYKTASIEISKTLYKYIDELCEEKTNTTMTNAKCFELGEIIDERIKEFQHR